LLTGESAPHDGYDITYVVDEPRRVTGGVTTLFGTNEGSLVMKLSSASCYVIEQFAWNSSLIDLVQTLGQIE